MLASDVVIKAKSGSVHEGFLGDEGEQFLWQYEACSYPFASSFELDIGT